MFACFSPLINVRYGEDEFRNFHLTSGILQANSISVHVDKIMYKRTSNWSDWFIKLCLFDFVDKQIR